MTQTTLQQDAKVIIIEDDLALLQIIEKSFNNLKIPTLGFDNAEDAYSYLWHAKTLPEVIWLDFQLNQMNGLEFLIKLKETAKLAQIPIVVVTNHESKETTDAMLSVGVQKYFVKVNSKLDDIVKETLALMKA